MKQQKLFRNCIIALPAMLFVILPFLDRIPVNDGCGWDGALYFSFVQHFTDGTWQGTINSYHIQRIFPSLLVALFAKIAGIDPDPQMVVKGFTVINLVSLLTAMWFYFRISKRIGLNYQTEIFGFIAIFYSFLILKFATFYPILMDMPAFALSFALLHSWLSRNFLTGFLIVILGSFTFPTFLLFGFILLAFTPPGGTQKNKEITIPGPGSFKLGLKRILLKILPLGAAAGYILYGIFIFRFRPDYMSEFADYSPIKPVSILIPGILSVTMIFLLVREISKHTFNFSVISIQPIKLAVLAITYITISKFQGSLGTDAAALDWKWFTVNLYKQSVQFPLGAFVSHILFFGPLIILAIIRWKSVLDTSSGYGPGLLMFLSIYLLLFITGSESRQFVVLLPFLSIITLKIWNHELGKLISTKMIILHMIICLMVSRCWYMINSPGFKEAAENLNTHKNFSDPILQRYFMSHGPWMSSNSYWTFLTVSVILFITYRHFLNKPVVNSTDQ